MFDLSWIRPPKVTCVEKNNEDIEIRPALNSPVDDINGEGGENKMGTNIFLYVVIKDSNDDISANISK